MSVEVCCDSAAIELTFESAVDGGGLFYEPLREIFDSIDAEIGSGFGAFWRMLSTQKTGRVKYRRFSPDLPGQLAC